jgi:hypothetical protein
MPHTQNPKTPMNPGLALLVWFLLPGDLGREGLAVVATPQSVVGSDSTSAASTMRYA